MGTKNSEHKKQFTWPLMFCVPESVLFKTHPTTGPFHYTGLLHNGKKIKKRREKGSLFFISFIYLFIFVILESFTDCSLEKLVP